MSEAANDPGDGKREPTQEEKIVILAVTCVCLGQQLATHKIPLASVLASYTDESLRAIISVGVRIALREAHAVMAGKGEPS